MTIFTDSSCTLFQKCYSFVRFYIGDFEATPEVGNEEEVEFIASDEEAYIPNPPNRETEMSDIELEHVVKEESDSSSEECVDNPADTNRLPGILSSRDGTEWHSSPLPTAQTIRRNILRERGGPSSISSLFTAKQTFKSIITNEICDIIL